jgi:hypothetical protein
MGDGGRDEEGKALLVEGSWFFVPQRACPGGGGVLFVTRRRWTYNFLPMGQAHGGAGSGLDLGLCTKGLGIP